MKTINLVSHTHWDREWYITFQQFRLRLVHTLDRLLALFDSDPFYRHFMLDGQTILLEDYLQIRPEKTEQIKTLIQSGRLVVGPWYVLADEFLVSPEATIRNLMEGRRICTQFGARMSVGYIPDPFGQIGQLPQILRGFGIESACFWRGLSDEPCELWWQSPDGSRVLVAYLRESYSNAASLSDDQPEVFTMEVKRLAQVLEPFSKTNQLLLMHGTDHAEPDLQTSSCVAYANEHLVDYRIEHTTLPQYIQSIRDELGDEANLPTVMGELRCSKRMPVLPGVLSTRIWIKQRNHLCENLLERWVEPFSAWAQLASPQNPRTTAYIYNQGALIHETWRLLMQCHPHDSICGCSVDQVHEEMRSRFDQVEQVGEGLTEQNLAILAQAADTRFSAAADADLLPLAIVVFNPGSAPRSDPVSVHLDLPASVSNIQILDKNGQVLPHQFEGIAGQEFLNTTFNRRDLLSALGMMQNGRIAGWVFKELTLSINQSTVLVDAVISATGEPNIEAWNAGLKELDLFLTNPAISTFQVRARTATSGTLTFTAPNVPGCGYNTFWIRSAAPAAAAPTLSTFDLVLQQVKQKVTDWLTASGLSFWAQRMTARLQEPGAYQIENEFFTVQVNLEDGTLTLVDRRSQQTYTGLNHFVDGGDCGDEYNYCPPLQDRLISPEIHAIRVNRGPVQESLEIDLQLSLPSSIGDDRNSRRNDNLTQRITTRAVLTRGLARLEIVTTVDNQASDHRLRVHFPVPFTAASAQYGGHFEVIERPLGNPRFDQTWVEQPRPEVPQRLFSTLSDGSRALTLASRGLPEVEARPGGVQNSELCLTLLRCVGWLSRDDFITRKGHAGPFVSTLGAQMPGQYRFEYALIPHSGGWQNAYLQAEAFDLPLRAALTPLESGPNAASTSLVDVHGQFSLSCIKMAEDGSGLVVRGYRWERGGEIMVRCNLPLHTCQQVRLDETLIQPLTAAADGFYRIKARPFEIVTLKFF
jgi:alpha-mannosidase